MTISHKDKLNLNSDFTRNYLTRGELAKKYNISKSSVQRILKRKSENSNDISRPGRYNARYADEYDMESDYTNIDGDDNNTSADVRGHVGAIDIGDEIDDDSSRSDIFDARNPLKNEIDDVDNNGSDINDTEDDNEDEIDNDDDNSRSSNIVFTDDSEDEDDSKNNSSLSNAYSTSGDSEDDSEDDDDFKIKPNRSNADNTSDDDSDNGSNAGTKNSNELVNRLRVLVTSRPCINEIISIIEELKAEGIIY
jgi:penicillin-binding protein